MHGNLSSANEKGMDSYTHKQLYKINWSGQELRILSYLKLLITTMKNKEDF